MQLRLTIVDPAAASGPVDCLVEAPPGGTLADVRDGLLQAVGRSSGQLWSADAALDDATPLGLPPLLDGGVITVDRPPRCEPRGLLELHVTAGPDAGAVHRLPPGEHGIGRAAQATVRVDDPKISRLHAMLRVATEGAVVVDVGSTNGTCVDHRPVGREGTPLAPGQVLHLGDTRLQLVVPDARVAACRPDGAGHLLVNRPPRLLAPKSPERVTLPTPPPEPDRLSFPLIALLVPLAAGLVLMLLTRNPTYLLFVLLSPAMLLGSHLGDRVGRRRRGRERQQEYDVALARARERIADAARTEAATRHTTHPGVASLLHCATKPGPRLWERRPPDPDFLSLRVGLGDLPASVDVQAPSAGDPGEPARLTSVPVTVALREVGVAGIAGPRRQALALARTMVAQLAGWHSPRHVGLVLLVAEPGDAPDWEWSRWLPHLRADPDDATLRVGLDDAAVRARVDELLSVLDRRLLATRATVAGSAGPSTVLVLDGAGSLRRVPGVARLLDEGPSVGLYAVGLEADSACLPAECRATLQIAGEVATRLCLTVAGHSPLTDVVTDGVSPAWSRRFARALAPLQDATPAGDGSALPTRLRLLDLLPWDAADPAVVEGCWRAAPRGTRLLLGVRPGGEPLQVDLARDGPHALIGGTTGSGKSELLQTMVAGLALANRPDELCFVLIDYKGGAAFQECAALPHNAGLVTDLDEHLTRRALASLGAELRRREAVLRAAGCRHVDELQRAGPPGAVLPRLVLVVDEFATLAEELPDFVGGLVGVAQRGRSLGVHLVLATQRPSGAVSADIRANTTLRVALRVTDAADSADVVDARDAADISPDSPGRAVARIGTGTLLPFHSARVGGMEVGTPPVTVRPLPWHSCGDAQPRPVAAGTEGPTDLARVVHAVRAAAERVGASAPRGPWLPPLADVLTLDEVPPGVAPWAAPLGVCDRPGRQRQDPLVVDLERGSHLLVAGSARSGRSTLLRTLAGSLAARFAVDDVHLYALDGGNGSLAGLAAMPHCGAVVPRDETGQGDRLLSRLALELDRRQGELARAGLGSVAEQRAVAVPAERLPWLVLLVDGWEGIRTAYDGVDHGRPIDTMLRLVREGPAAGLHVVITGERGLLTSPVAAAMADRLLLRLADRADYAIAGVPARQVPTTMPAGRAVLADDGAEVQVAVLDRAHDGSAQAAALRRIAASAAAKAEAAATPRHRPIRVRPLPRRVRVDEIEVGEAANGRHWALLGVGGDAADPVGVDLAADGAAFVIAGPPGSGKSAALATIGRWLGGRGVGVVLVAPDGSPLRQLVGGPGVLSCLGPGAAGELTNQLAGHDNQLVVLADDAERLRDTPVEAPLTELLRQGGPALVLAGSSVEMPCQFRGLTVEARRHRRGLLLGAIGPVGGDLLGVRAACTGEMPPGRGLLVLLGATTPVQVALSA